MSLEAELRTRSIDLEGGQIHTMWQECGQNIPAMFLQCGGYLRAIGGIENSMGPSAGEGIIWQPQRFALGPRIVANSPEISGYPMKLLLSLRIAPPKKHEPVLRPPDTHQNLESAVYR